MFLQLRQRQAYISLRIILRSVISSEALCQDPMKRGQETLLADAELEWVSLFGCIPSKGRLGNRGETLEESSMDRSWVLSTMIFMARESLLFVVVLVDDFQSVAKSLLVAIAQGVRCVIVDVDGKFQSDNDPVSVSRFESRLNSRPLFARRMTKSHRSRWRGFGRMNQYEFSPKIQNPHPHTRHTECLWIFLHCMHRQQHKAGHRNNSSKRQALEREKSRSLRVTAFLWSFTDV